MKANLPLGSKDCILGCALKAMTLTSRFNNDKLFNSGSGKVNDDLKKKFCGPKQLQL
jgi:hypothetical protein